MFYILDYDFVFQIQLKIGINVTDNLRSIFYRGVLGEGDNVVFIFFKEEIISVPLKHEQHYDTEHQRSEKVNAQIFPQWKASFVPRGI